MKDKNITFLPHILWTVELQGIFVVDKQTGNHYFLHYPEAAVWDLLSRKYFPEQIPPVISAIEQVNLDAATRIVSRCLMEWSGYGLINTKNEYGKFIDHNHLQ
ncbi:MAG: hypothetical protein H6560_20925 [Lewinellaceae bacterium]|nr:hypothetical protein [Lewinellaceae bacterium]